MQAREVERPAMAAEARRERRQGAGGEEEGDRGDRTHRRAASALECATHAERHLKLYG